MANLQWTGISDNVDTGAVVEAKLNTSFSAAETAITSLENSTGAIDTRLADMLNVELDAKSLVTQEPTATDTPLQMNFGAGVVNTNVALASDGTITFRTTGKYSINLEAMYGRSGSAGTSLMHYRATLNSAQVGSTLSAKIDSDDTLVPFTATYFIDANENDVMKFEFYRDSAGHNSGGLFSTATAISGWENSPSAAIVVRKA